MPPNALLDSPESDEVSSFRSSGDRPSTPDDEPVLAVCANSNKLQASEMLIGGLLGTVGFGCLVAVIVNLIQQVPNLGGAAAFGFMGLMVLGLGVFIIGDRLFTPPHAIAVTESGIELLQKQGSQKLKWNEIHKVLMLEFYPHRAANLVLNVTIEPVQGSSIKFDTNYEGEPELVIAYLNRYCDYLVRNPQGFTRNVK